MKYAHIEWNNGRPFSTDYGDVYFSAEGGLDETEYVFLRHNNLHRRWRRATKFIIGETGFGTGLNFLVTLKHWLDSSPSPARLFYFSVERHPLSQADLQRVADIHPVLKPFYDELIASYPLPMPGLHVLDFAQGRVRLCLYFGDVVQMLQQMNCKVDAWYLDGFAPSKNPAMWSDEVFTLLGRRSSAGATFSTYTASGQVRRALEQAGFTVMKSAGFGSKRDMLNGKIFEQRCFSVDKPWFEPPHQSRVRPADGPEVLVIGAGLAGLTVAWRLVQRGRRVRIVDRGPAPAPGASGNPAGLVIPRLSLQQNDDARFYTHALSHAIRCLDELQSSGTPRFWFDSGNLVFGDAGRLRALCQLHQYPDDYASMLNARQVDAAAGVAIGRPGLYLKRGGWVRPDVLCRTIDSACGRRLERVQADVRDIRHENRQWRLLDAHQNVIASAAQLVLANAAECRNFGPVSWLPLAPVRGQLTVVQATAASRDLGCGLVFEHYLTPALENGHVTGASFEPGRTGTGLSRVAQAENLSKLVEFLPGMFGEPDGLTGRAAVRAVCGDRVPLAGALPDVNAFARDYPDLFHGRPGKCYPPASHLPGLYISGGHGSRGLVSCFVCAEVVAAMINQDPPPLEKDLLDYINPARFPVRKLKRNRPC